MRLNILYIIDNPQLYGSEIHLLDIVKYMKEIHNIKIIALKNGPLLNLFNKINVNYEIVPTGYIMSLQTLRKIRTIIKEFKPSIVHAHQPKALFIGGGVAKCCKISLISTIHSQAIDHAMIYKGLKREIVYFAHSFFSFISQLLSKKIIFVNNCMFQSSKFPRKSVMLYNWVQSEISLESKKIRFVKKEYDRIKFLVIGSVTFAKGFDLLFQFIEKLLNGSCSLDFTVDILGGIDEKFLSDQKKLFSPIVFKKIKFHGYLSNKEEYFRNSDIFILFSRSETFGLVYAEAMAYGLPIIAGDLPVLNEIIPSINSLSFDLDVHISYLKKLKLDESFKKEIFTLNREKVCANFEYYCNMELLEKLYESVISNKKGSDHE